MGAEGERKPVDQLETILPQHREIVKSFVQAVSEMPTMKRVLARSDNGAVLIAYEWESADKEVMGDMEVMGKIAGIEWDLTHRFPETVIVFDDVGEGQYDEEWTEDRLRGAVSVFQR